MYDSICRNGAIICVHCGKFMGTKDLDDGYMNYTPDSDYSVEAIEWEHKSCKEKSKPPSP